MGNHPHKPQKDVKKMSEFNKTTIDTINELVDVIARIEDKYAQMHEIFKEIRTESTPDDDNYTKSFYDFVDVNAIKYNVEMVEHCIGSARRALRMIEIEQFRGMTNLIKAQKE